ncbi:hemerythrin domain-containing protein [Ectothiorhodospiraceae bacterium BW-2]|nr:hemerythrin domain-containing protein [Ectothiorhodospiraceae bacterium BW-2]
MTIFQQLSTQHQRCDSELSATEVAITKQQWSEASAAWSRFMAETERHFQLEELQLFPKLEAQIGSPMGPTAVMRHEHQQLRELLTEVTTLIAAQAREAALGEIETVLVLLQQHNGKEESILYPMADRFGISLEVA